MIVIIDYGMGNLRSVTKALEHLGVPNEVTEDPARLATADKLILPGVGAFGDAMTELDRRGLTGPLKERVAAGVPLLGICLGMQLVMDSSEESPGVTGLGLIEGTVVRFRTSLKVPQMGWNTVRQARPAPLFRGIPDRSWFYFVHSYYVQPAPGAREAMVGMTDYDVEFPSVLWQGNIMATQFHPEKSQTIGLRMLRNFADLETPLSVCGGGISSQGEQT